MRLFGVTIPEEKQLQYGLTAVYGIGLSMAQQVLDEAKIDKTKRVKDTNDEEENKIRLILEKKTLEGDLRRGQSKNIKRLKDIGSYRGSRHSKSLPVRGQRTRTNSRNVRPYKGRKTMGSGKKAAEKK